MVTRNRVTMLSKKTLLTLASVVYVELKLSRSSVFPMRWMAMLKSEELCRGCNKILSVPKTRKNTLHTCIPLTNMASSVAS